MHDRPLIPVDGTPLRVVRAVPPIVIVILAEEIRVLDRVPLPKGGTR